MAAIPIYPARHRFPDRWGWLSPLRSRWTYRRILYLAISFPLGLGYFIALVVGFAVGGALSWTLVGVAILILIVLGSRWAGDVEALLNRHLVGIEIRRPPTWYERDVPLRDQARQVLFDPSTWTGLIFLFSRFPLGIAAFVSCVIAGALSTTLILAPMAYGNWGPFGQFFVDRFGTEPLEACWLEIMGWRIDTAGEAWAVFPLGFVVLFVSLHVLNLEAWLMGRWAKLMLGSRARDIPPPPATLVDADVPVLPPAGVVHPLIEALTPREREVLLLIARGYSNAEIAEAFVVSEGTVKTHVKRILAKLEVRDRTQAAVFAFDSGFVTPETASEPEPR